MKKLFFVLLTVFYFLSLNVKAQYISISASFYSEALEKVERVNIFLPADYYVNLEQQYAVIYYLHGAGGNHNSGHSKANLYGLLHLQDTSITSPQAIFVCPDGSCEPYLGSDYLNSELYGNYADYTTIDLIEFIETNFRAIPSRDFRFVCGTSMGGFGSTYHALNNLDLFRASFPFIGFPAVSDDFLLLWRDLTYEENGSYYDISYNAGTKSKLFLTMAGGLSPNLSLPNFVELPWDSTGELVDSVVAKWRQYDASNKVRDIPQDKEMAFYLGCGTSDYMGTYPLYLQFMDSLDFYGIPYQSNYFDGGHEDNTESWIYGLTWLDSIINHSFLTMGVETIQKESNLINLYPNPANQTLHISFEAEKTAPAIVTIYNQLGQQIKSGVPVEMQPGNNELSLDVASLETGVYLLQLAIDGQIVTKKFIKY